MANSTIKRPTGKFIQSGSLTFSNVGTTAKSIDVTFDVPFTRVPEIVISLTGSGYNRRVDTANATTTGFTANGAMTSGTATSTIWANWIAVGE